MNCIPFDKNIKKFYFLSILITCSALEAASNTKPNILFIMADDHTSQAIGVYNSRLAPLNPTPTIDSLAKEGMIMANAFCQNAICTPSRASIMTGQSSAVNGVMILSDRLPDKRQYLAHEMNKAGYDTAVIGKWHLKELPSAFNYYRVLPNQGSYNNPVFRDIEGTESFKVKNSTVKKGIQMEGHSSDCIAESVLYWFKEKRDPQKPFFLKMHFKAPHEVYKYASRYKSYLEDVTIPEPENMRDRKNHGSIATRGHNDELVPYIGASIGRRCVLRGYTKFAKSSDQSKDDEQIQKSAYQGYLKAYLRCVKGVDDNVKRIIEYLKSENLFDNTVIMYTGDQGFYLGEHDYIDKRWPYEESMRMPLIIRYPKSIKPGRTDAIVENIDFAPTMLDFAGVPTPKYMHGMSFRSILETGKEPSDWKQSAYYHYWDHMKALYNPACIAIRDKQYKLILYYGARSKSDRANTPPAWELYDLKRDPTEDNNVYDNPEYSSVIASLKKKLKARRTELGDDDPKFPINKIIEEYWDYGPEEKVKAIEISNAYYRSQQGSKKKNKK